MGRAIERVITSSCLAEAGCIRKGNNNDDGIVGEVSEKVRS